MKTEDIKVGEEYYWEDPSDLGIWSGIVKVKSIKSSNGEDAVLLCEHDKFSIEILASELKPVERSTMGWNEDGSAELDAVVKGIRSESREQIAERLEEWAKKGVDIKWEDFPERAVLETAAKYLKSTNN